MTNLFGQVKKLLPQNEYRLVAGIDFDHCKQKGKIKYCRNCATEQIVKCENRKN
jgi:hypothetical protein